MGRRPNLTLLLKAKREKKLKRENDEEAFTS